MRCDQLVVGAANLLVKLQIGRTTTAAPLGVLVKNAAEKERIISNVRAQQKALLGCRASERDEHVGDVRASSFCARVRRLQTIDARKSFEQRSDVIAQLAVVDARSLQNVTSQDVKIKSGRDRKMTGVAKNRIDQPRIVEHQVARLGV